MDVGEKNFFLVGQVHKLMFGQETATVSKLSDTAFRNALPYVVRESDKMVLAKLRAAGAIGTQAPCVTMASVRSIQACLTDLGMDAAVVELMGSMAHSRPPPTFNPPFQHQPPPDHPPMGASHNTPSTSPAQKTTTNMGATPHKHNHQGQPNSSQQHTSASPSPSIPPTIYPTTLKIPDLLDSQRRETYGLLTMTGGSVPNHLKGQVMGLMEWSKNIIQLDRDSKYSPCQETTLQSMHETIMGFMGYMVKYKGIHVQSLSLDLYLTPSHVTSFLAYIVARGVGRGWVAKHLTTCMKVASYINSKHPYDQHPNLQYWLSRLCHQLPNLIPMSMPKALPSATSVWEWVDKLVAICKAQYEEDMEM